MFLINRKKIDKQKKAENKIKEFAVLGSCFENEKQADEFFERIKGDIRFDREAQDNLRNKLIIEVINNKTNIQHKNEIIELLIKLWDDCKLSRRNVSKIFDEFGVLNSEQLAGYVIKQVQIRHNIIIGYARGANMVKIKTNVEWEPPEKEITMDELLSKDLDAFIGWLVSVNGSLIFFKR